MFFVLLNKKTINLIFPTAWPCNHRKSSRRREREPFDCKVLALSRSEPPIVIYRSSSTRKRNQKNSRTRFPRVVEPLDSKILLLFLLLLLLFLLLLLLLLLLYALNSIPDYSSWTEYVGFKALAFFRIKLEGSGKLRRMRNLLRIRVSGRAWACWFYFRWQERFSTTNL